MAAHVCNTSTQEIEAEGLEVQSHPQLGREFKAFLSSLRPYLKNKKVTKLFTIYCLQRKGGQKRPTFLGHQEMTEDHDLK